MKVLIGADPEFFLSSKEQPTYSAYGLLPGTKTAPYKVPNGAVQVDGMAVEFNINPADNVNDFVYNVQSVLRTLRDMIPHEYTFKYDATATFNEEHIRKQPYEALMLGCDPDYDAYTESMKQGPNASAFPLIRAAGGHVHIGWTKDANIYDEDHFSACCQLARQLDYYLGLPSLLYDKDTGRRRIYGQPGSFRPKPYGLEYRTLSNYWIKSDAHIKNVFYNAKLAFTELVDRRNDVYEQYGNDAKVIIEDNIPDLAYKYINLLGLPTV